MTHDQYGKFSKRELEIALASGQLEAILHKFKLEIEKELSICARPCIERIISNVNSTGHDLRIYDAASPVDIGFRDDRTDGENYTCDLRVGFDLIVSIGFRDTRDFDDP